ncbi:MAG: D-alanyl-D-alanine carboxypeptidase family protein [Oscillospiraceae bacterium]|nr:D-alanyl-D-alanine carboxypeptidase family protein [Oscillospiraceae bacterium]
MGDNGFGFRNDKDEREALFDMYAGFSEESKESAKGRKAKPPKPAKEPKVKAAKEPKQPKPKAEKQPKPAKAPKEKPVKQEKPPKQGKKPAKKAAEPPKQEGLGYSVADFEDDNLFTPNPPVQNSFLQEAMGMHTEEAITPPAVPAASEAPFTYEAPKPRLSFGEYTPNSGEKVRFGQSIFNEFKEPEPEPEPEPLPELSLPEPEAVEEPQWQPPTSYPGPMGEQGAQQYQPYPPPYQQMPIYTQPYPPPYAPYQMPYLPYQALAGNLYSPPGTPEPAPQTQPLDDDYNSKYDYDPTAPMILRKKEASSGKRRSANNPRRLSARLRAAERKDEFKPYNSAGNAEEPQSSALAAVADPQGYEPIIFFPDSTAAPVSHIQQTTPTPVPLSSAPAREPQISHASGFGEYVPPSAEKQSAKQPKINFARGGAKGLRPKKSLQHGPIQEGRDSNITKIFAFAAIIICVLAIVFLVYAQTLKGGTVSKKKDFWDGASAENVVVSQLSKESLPKDAKALTTASAEHPLDSKYAPKVAALKVIPKGSGLKLDAAAQSALKEMVTTLKANQKAEGLCVIKAYVSYSSMKSAYNKAVAENRYVGMSSEAAETAAALVTPVAGTSEYQLGTVIALSTDGTQQDYFDTTEAGKWIVEHCFEFGFVLRYPKEKVEVTGHSFEPYCFRYVGPEAAKFMHDNKMCIEDYNSLINS